MGTTNLKGSPGFTMPSAQRGRDTRQDPLGQTEASLPPPASRFRQPSPARPPGTPAGPPPRQRAPNPPPRPPGPAPQPRTDQARALRAPRTGSGGQGHPRGPTVPGRYRHRLSSSGGRSVPPGRVRRTDGSTPGWARKRRRAEPSRAEPSRAEPSRAEPVPSRPVPSRYRRPLRSRSPAPAPAVM
ncbi:serine/arginine repetitive matrix protein 1-like [Molothrus aeneus]|uniref:serine/arginine repetitive matrix protein 1-like n=1 Tax=Molothrus aeneus TaxID=84833 RepID=UPI00345A73C1